MNSPTDDLIQQAVNAGTDGDYNSARKLLTQVVKEDPKNARAWYLLSQVVDKKEHSIYCLEKALEIDPDNLQVSQRLRQLKSDTKEPLPEDIPVARKAPQEPRELPKSKSSLILISGIAIIGIIIIIGLVLIGLKAIGVFESEVPVVEQPIASEVQPATIAPTGDIPKQSTELAPATSTIPGITPSSLLTKELPSTVDPRLFVINTADMPQGYGLVPGETGYSSNENVANNRENPSAVLEQLQTWGRVNGYYSWFQREGSIQSFIRSQAVVMQSSEGAHAYFIDMSNRNAINGWTLISSPLIGEEANVYSRVTILGSVFELTFRKQNILASITQSGPIDQISLDDLMRYAQIMDTRIVDNPPNINLTLLPNITPVVNPTETTTPMAAPTPTSQVIEQSQTLGPIWNETRDESYSVTITVHNVRYSIGEEYNAPRSGYVYAIIDVTINNLGPNPIRSIGPYDFQILDANGALRDDEYISEARDCRLDLVDLSPGGTISGCIGFEVPVDGKLEFIYAPYRYEGLEPGRFLSFLIRQ
jgi:hypothetical protein